MTKRSEQEIEIEIVPDKGSITNYLILFNGVVEGSIEATPEGLTVYNLLDEVVLSEDFIGKYDLFQAPARATRALLQDYFKRHDG